MNLQISQGDLKMNVPDRKLEMIESKIDRIRKFLQDYPNGEFAASQIETLLNAYDELKLRLKASENDRKRLYGNSLTFEIVSATTVIVQALAVLSVLGKEELAKKALQSLDVLKSTIFEDRKKLGVTDGSLKEIT